MNLLEPPLTLIMGRLMAKPILRLYSIDDKSNMVEKEDIIACFRLHQPCQLTCLLVLQPISSLSTALKMSTVLSTIRLTQARFG